MHAYWYTLSKPLNSQDVGPTHSEEMMLLDMDQVRDVDPPHDINIDKFFSKIAAMYKSKAQDLVNWDNIETAKVRKPPYEMEAPVSMPTRRPGITMPTSKNSCMKPTNPQRARC